MYYSTVFTPPVAGVKNEGYKFSTVTTCNEWSLWQMVHYCVVQWSDSKLTQTLVLFLVYLTQCLHINDAVRLVGIAMYGM